MGAILRKIVIAVAIYTLFLLEVCECRRRKSSKKQIQSRETNLFDFVRLVFLRVIYGLATSMGFGEGISELFGGIFVPPGVDDDDYGDFDY